MQAKIYEYLSALNENFKGNAFLQVIIFNDNAGVALGAFACLSL